MPMPAQAVVILTFAYRKDGRRWTGECLELGTATYGRTLEQVHRELTELVELHLEVLERAGERERFFEEHGIRLYRAGERPARVQATLPVDDDGTFVHAHEVEVALAAPAA